MLDPGSILGIVSLTIQGIEVCIKTFERFNEYKTALHDIPNALEECKARLDLLSGVIKRNQDEERKEGPSLSEAHMKATYFQISKLVRRLNSIIQDLQKAPGDGLRKLLSKSAKSLRKEKEISDIQQSLSRAVIDLTLGHVDNLRSPIGHVCVSQMTVAVNPVPRSPLAHSYGLPPNHVSRFIGREQTIMDVKKEILSDPKRTSAISLWGIGGQGKTQIALKLVDDAEVKNAYSPVLWINASSRSALGEQFGKIAEQMARSSSVFPDLQSKIDFVETTLEQNPKPCLLIFDNFATSFEISQHAEFLPPRQPYAIIYISREFNKTFPGASIMVPAMPSHDAVELLLDRSAYKRTSEHVEQAREIVSRLGCLPLAILQAGAWLRSSKLPLNQFLHQFSLYIAFALDQPGHTSQSNRNVFTTWEMAMEAFSPDKKRCEEITHMLLVCSILHNDVVNGDFASHLWQSFDNAPPWMRQFLTDGVWSYRKFASIVQQLSDFSLVNILDWRHGHCHFSLHPMVRQWLQIRVKLSTLAETLFEVIRLVDALVRRTRNQAMDSRTRNHVRLYVWSCIKAVSDFEMLEGASALVLGNARVLLDSKYNAALFLNDDPNFGGNVDYHLTRDIPVSGTILLEECFEGYTHLLGPKDPMTLEVSERLGVAYIDDKNFDKAEKIIRANLELRGNTVSPALARWYAQQGKTEEAATLYSEVLTESDEKSSATLEQLTSIMWCAQNDIDSGEQARAEKLLLKIIRVARPEPQQDRIKASALEILASIYWGWTRRSESQAMQLRAFQLCETVYGCEDARTIHVGHELARYYFTTEEWAKCEALYTILIARYEVVHGPENTHTNQARHCHSHTLCNLGRAAEGEAAHAEAFYLLLANPGIKDELVQSIFRCLDSIYDYPDKEADQRALYEDVLKKARDLLDMEDEFRMNLTHDLATIYVKCEMYAEAEQLWREIVEIREDIFQTTLAPPNSNSDQDHIDEELPPSKDENKEHTDSQEEQTATEAEQQVEQLRVDRFRSLINAKEELALTLYHQKKLIEAEPLFSVVLKAKQDEYGTCGPSTLDTAHLLGEVCDALGKSDEAERIHEDFEVAALEMQISMLRESMRKRRGSHHAHEITMRDFEGKLEDLKIRCVSDEK